jgi:hypothetical protein
MAENERLDVCNRRFRWIVSDILRGLPPAEIAQKLIRKLAGAWNYIHRHGFNALEVISIASAGGALDAAIRDTGGNDLAHLIRLHAHPVLLAGTVMDDVNRSAVEQVIDSGLQRAICRRDGPSLLEAMSTKRQIMAAAEAAIPDLTESLLFRRTARVRAPKVVAPNNPLPAVSIPMPAVALHQSLLSAAQRAAYGVR